MVCGAGPWKLESHCEKVAPHPATYAFITRRADRGTSSRASGASGTQMGDTISEKETRRSRRAMARSGENVLLKIQPLRMLVGGGECHQREVVVAVKLEEEEEEGADR